MKTSPHYLFLLTAAITLLCSCSSDDSTYNPYAYQEKTPFYPQEINIEKQNPKRKVAETWTFEYGKDNTITAYTHTTTNKLDKDGYTEETIERESGNLSYYNGSITNRITIEKAVSSYDYEKYHKEEIIENAECNSDGRITTIKRFIDRYNKDGIKESSTTTSRTFTYTGDYCTASTYTDADDATGAITHSYTYSWDGNHDLTSIEVEEKEKNARTRKQYKYSYGKLGKDYGFHANAFLYNQMPQIYAAMGYFGKDCPYIVESEQQTFKIFIDGQWETDNSADNKIFTFISNNADEFKYDISSEIYTTNYDIKFIK